MSSRDIYSLACHPLNEEAVTVEQGTYRVRKTNTRRNVQQAEELARGCRERGQVVRSLQGKV